MRETPFRITTPAPREVWHRLLKADPEAVPYQSPAWMDSICALGGFEDASRLYEASDGRQFVLPMARRKGLPTILTVAASQPNGWGMGGILTSGDFDVADAKAVFEDLSRLPYLRMALRPNPRLGDVWAAAAPPGTISIPRSAHVIDLDGGFDRVWSERFARNTRTNVRKAERSGVVVESDTTGRLVPVFYDLLQASFDRWAQKQHEPRALARFRGRRRDPLKKFEAIVESMRGAAKIWVAWVDGRPAATMSRSPVWQCERFAGCLRSGRGGHDQGQ